MCGWWVLVSAFLEVFVVWSNFEPVMGWMKFSCFCIVSESVYLKKSLLMSCGEQSEEVRQDDLKNLIF